MDAIEKGYGAALIEGIDAARGEFIVFTDCDGSNNFGDVPKFVDQLAPGSDLVMGNRFLGGIEGGAMPWLHRYLRNPVLSSIGRLFFRVRVGDFHCAVRGLRKSSFEQIPMVTKGLEFASELVVKAALNGLKITEISTVLRPDGRSRRPHSRTWRDGWRHHRFMLLFAPQWLFFAPAMALLTLGGLISLRLMFGPVVIANVRFDIHTMLLAATAIVGAFQLCRTAVFARTLSTALGILPPTDRLEKTRRWLSLEKGLILGLLLVITGALWILKLVYDWKLVQFGNLDAALTLRELIPATTMIITGLQTSFGSFFPGTVVS